MTIVTTNALFEELSKIIEFPDHVIDVNISLAADQDPLVECTYYPELKIVGDEIPTRKALFSLVENGKIFPVSPERLKQEAFALRDSIENNKKKLIEAKINIWPYH